MSKNKNKTEKLKKLLQSSRSFDNAEKKQLIKRIPELNQSEVEEAILVFTEEQKKWAEMDDEDQKILALTEQFATNSKHEASELTRSIIRNAEHEELSKSEADAEELLKTID